MTFMTEARIEEEVKKAVMAERERCAEIARDTHPPDHFGISKTGAWIDAQVEIEKKIREGK